MNNTVTLSKTYTIYYKDGILLKKFQTSGKSLGDVRKEFARLNPDIKVTQIYKITILTS